MRDEARGREEEDSIRSDKCCLFAGGHKFK